MSKQREKVDFGETLPSEKMTQILGATLACVAKSTTYEQFKSCIIIPTESEEVKPTILQETTADIGQAIEGTVEAVGEVFTFKKYRK